MAELVEVDEDSIAVCDVPGEWMAGPQAANAPVEGTQASDAPGDAGVAGCFATFPPDAAHIVPCITGRVSPSVP